MDTKYWRLASTTLKQPELRSSTKPRRRSSRIFAEFLCKRSRSSIWQRSPLKRHASVSPLVRQQSIALAPALAKGKGGRSVDTLRKDTEPDEKSRVSPLIKHRYFTLTEGPVYDLTSASVTQVTIT